MPVRALSISGSSWTGSAISSSSSAVGRTGSCGLPATRAPPVRGVAGRNHGPESAEIDHTVVAMDVEPSDGDAVLTMVMRDVAALLVEPGDTPVSGRQHAGFMDGLAALSARCGDGTTARV